MRGNTLRIERAATETTRKGGIVGDRHQRRGESLTLPVDQERKAAVACVAGCGPRQDGEELPSCLRRPDDGHFLRRHRTCPKLAPGSLGSSAADLLSIIHPSQVAIIRDAYRPDAKAVSWAEAVLAAAAEERGVFTFDGRMVDEPVLRHARALLRRVAR